MKIKINRPSIIIAFGALLISALTYLAFVYDLNLKNRPYLYIESEWPLTWTYVDPKTKTPGHRKIMVDITMKNEGVIPASIVKADWYIAADNKPIKNPSQFYKEKRGKDLLYQTVFPKQTIDLPKYKPDVAPTTKIVDLNIVISYQGTTRSVLGLLGKYKTYWYLLKSTYEFKYGSDNTIEISQISYETDWDRNRNASPPKAKPCIKNEEKRMNLKMTMLYKVLFGLFIISGTYILSKQVFEHSFKKQINFKFEQLPLSLKIALMLFGDVKKYRSGELWSAEYFPAGDRFTSREKFKLLAPFIGFTLLCIGTIVLLFL